MGRAATILQLLVAVAVVALGVGQAAARRVEPLSGTVTARARPENDRARTCDVRAYGAVGDGVTKDTAAILRTIAACSNDSVILLPAPGQYLSAPFNLTSHTTLRIEPGAALLASDDLADWFIVAPLPSYPNGREKNGPRYVSFIGGVDVVDVAIDGGGLLDGQGEQWYLRHWNDTLDYDRGRLIEPMFCFNFRVTDLYILNPPFWAVHPYACDGVLVENVDIRAPIASPNTDGVDPDSTINVVIRCATERPGLSGTHAHTHAHIHTGTRAHIHAHAHAEEAQTHERRLR
jgi:polygalacturonase